MSSCLPVNDQLSAIQDSEKIHLMLENCLFLFGTAQSTEIVDWQRTDCLILKR